MDRRERPVIVVIAWQYSQSHFLALENKIQAWLPYGLILTRARPPSTYYQIKYVAGYVDVHYGRVWQSEVEIAISQTNMTALLFRNGDARLMERQGEIAVEGHKQQWFAFLDNFGLKGSSRGK